MLDQCHNVEAKIPGQIRSVLNVQEMTARALLVDGAALEDQLFDPVAELEGHEPGVDARAHALHEGLQDAGVAGGSRCSGGCAGSQ